MKIIIYTYSTFNFFQMEIHVSISFSIYEGVSQFHDYICSQNILTDIFYIFYARQWKQCIRNGQRNKQLL